MTDARTDAVEKEIARFALFGCSCAAYDEDIREAAERILAIADTHPTPAQLRARELLAKVCDLHNVAGPVAFEGDVIHDENDYTVLEIAYSIDAPALADFINIACGWETGNE